MAKAPGVETKKKASDGGFQPYVPDKTDLPEFTWSALITGSLLGIVFGASSLYLVLRVGMTVSASIPVAVLSITLFRGLSRAFGIRRATILENNIVQTAGSAGESIAFGVGVTMPAVMLIGFDMTLTRIMVVSVLGGLLGILMMIPLRRAFIVQMHGKPGEPGTLSYPEGTACAEVLKSGESASAGGGMVFVGFGIAAVHKFLTEGMNLFRETLGVGVSALGRSARFTCEMASELLGVGYIIGARTSAIMMAGAVLGYLVIMPMITLFGDTAGQPVPPADKTLIGQMDIKALKENYLNYIGAGCVAAAGVISMLRTLPMILRSLLSGLSGWGAKEGTVGPARTERDMSLRFVLLGSLVLLGLLVMFLWPDVGVQNAVVGSLLVLLFGFLFVTVSSRLTGEIGSSSNPISGMTVGTLLLTCLIFLSLKMTTPADQLLALSVGGVVCIAASNGGTTSQDLKTGYLVGATPVKQQWAIIVGALTSAGVIGVTLLMFNTAGSVTSSKPENLPRVNLIGRKLEDLPMRTHENQSYREWRPTEAELPTVRAETYLIDAQGKAAFIIDPAIMGKLENREDGTKRNFKFDAPKTQVMALIIKGLLKQNLRWDLVLLGALIAVTLELCGISSLAFAVGVYVPIQYSTPIFVGGLIRAAVDWWRARGQRKDNRDEIAALAEEETSGGVLLASGYIAGGSLVGVLLAFLNFPFAKDLQDKLNYETTIANTWLDRDWPAIVAGLALVLALLLVALRKSSNVNKNPE